MAHTLDRYLGGTSPLHRLDPRLKVVVVLLFVVATLLLPDGAWLAFGLSWLCIWWTTRLAELPYRLVFRRSLIIAPFLLTALTLAVNTPGSAIATWSVGPLHVVLSDAGLLRFTSVLARGWLAIQVVVLLTAVTRFPDLMHALHHLRVPAVLVSIISFMYRYLFVLAEEAQRLLRARRARSARLPSSGSQGGTLWWRAQVTGHMVGQLFSRSLDRSDRVYHAMLARGYQGRLLTMSPHTMGPADWNAGLVALLAVLLIQIAAHVAWLP